MGIPELTHLQWLVVTFVLGGNDSGAKLRSALDAAGIKTSLPAFYQLMARIEQGGWLKGRYEQSVVEGQPIKERCFIVTARGRKQWQVSVDFYGAR